MLSSFVIVLREAFEASLVIGLVLAFLRKIERSDAAGAVWGGALAAVGASAALGATLFLAGGELEGTAEALYEGAAMLLAAGVLTAMVFWMRRQAATIGGHLRQQVGDAVREGSTMGLAVVAFVAVGREGVETALFLFASTGEAGAVATIVGGVLGLATAVAVGVLLYRGSIRLDLRQFFLVTGLLVILFAGYLLAGGVGELGEAAGSKVGEMLGPVLGMLYAVGLGLLYLRATRVVDRPSLESATASAG